MRHGLRQLRRRPGFSAIVLLALGLGIGASVGLASVVDSLIVRRLPYGNANRVQAFWTDYDWTGEEYDFLRPRLGVFDDLAAFSTNDAPYAPSSAASGTTELPFVVASPSMFSVLGVHPMLGRAFGPDDDRPGAPPVIVISYGLWQQDFAGARDVIGRQVLLDGEPVMVIGVMPKGFFFPTPEMLAWRPLQLGPANRMYQVGYLTLIASAKAERVPGPDRWRNPTARSSARRAVHVSGRVEQDEECTRGSDPHLPSRATCASPCSSCSAPWLWYFSSRARTRQH